MSEYKPIKQLIKETKKKKKYKYGWKLDVSEENLHQIEREEGLISQARLIEKLFPSCILSNTLCEHLIAEGIMEELRTPYTIAEARAEAGEEVEEYEYYEDEYQYFIVDLGFGEETTLKILERANTDIYLRYSEEYDVYIMSIGNFGMSRELIPTDIRITDEYCEDNYWRD